MSHREHRECLRYLRVSVLSVALTFRIGSKYHLPSLTAFVILICNRFTSFSTSFQSMSFHWFFSLSCLFASFSSSDVIEFLAFIGLPSFTQSNTNDKSAHFHVEANFEPLCNLLPVAICFLSYPLPSALLSLLAESLPIFGNATGLPSSAP